MAKFNQNIRYGIELEMHVQGGQYAVANALQEEGIDACSMSWGQHTNGSNSNWHVTTDGSLGSYSTGVEVVSPILKGDDGLKQIEKVCKALEKVDARINKSCGFHVHVEARGMLNDTAWAKTLVMMYSKYEHVLDAFQPKSRKSNNAQYCQKVGKNENIKEWAKTIKDCDKDVRSFWREHFNGYSQGPNGKYHKLNFAPLWKQGTVEFRHHSGTTEFAKISAWVKTVVALVDNADRNKERKIKPINPKHQKALDEAHSALSTNQMTNEGMFSAKKQILDADLKAFFKVIRPDRQTAKTLRERFAKNWNK